MSTIGRTQRWRDRPIAGRAQRVAPDVQTVIQPNSNGFVAHDMFGASGQPFGLARTATRKADSGVAAQLTDRWGVANRDKRHIAVPERICAYEL